MAKLTLSVDGRVVSSAKQYAKERGVSVSEMVEKYLSAVAGGTSEASAHTPVLNSMRGILRQGNPQDYQKYLAKKYR